MASEVLLSLDVAPEWASVAVVRSAVHERLKDNDALLADRLMVAASELVENAVKYGDWSAPGRIVITLERGDDSLAVEVAHRIAPAAPHLSALVAALASLRDSTSALKAYRARMRKLAEGHREGSRMGLVRVAHEAGCTLEATIAGDTLTVRAAVRR